MNGDSDMRSCALGAVLLGVCGLFMTGQAKADERSPDGVWTVMNIMPKAVQNEQP